MKLTTKLYLKKWWLPHLLFWIAVTPLTVYSCQNRIGSDLAGVLFLLSWFTPFVTFMYKTNKKWYVAIGYILLSIFEFLYILLLSTIQFFIVQSTPDEYAKDLVIPKDIKIHKPKLYNDQDTIGNFELYEDGQPGQYRYEVRLSNIDTGMIYLKAYEITHNDRLSLEEVSLCQVVNFSDTLKRFQPQRGFTIYEGDWGHPYAVRFEVWYRPSNQNKQNQLFHRRNRDNEHLLITKNYIIEGWQR